MTLEQLVPTLEVCQQLKAAGFPQDTALRWSMQHEPHIPDVEPTWMSTAFNEPILCAAPTASELEEWLMTRGKNTSLVISPDFMSYWQSVRRRPHRVAVVTRVAALAALVLEAAG